MKTEELTYDSKSTIVSYEDFDGYLASYMLKHGFTFSAVKFEKSDHSNQKYTTASFIEVDEEQTKNMMNTDMGYVKYIADSIFVMIGRPEFVIITVSTNKLSMCFTPAKPHRVGQMED